MASTVLVDVPSRIDAVSSNVASIIDALAQRRAALTGGQLLVDLAQPGLYLLLGRLPAASVNDAVVVFVVDLGQAGAELFGFLDRGLHVITDRGEQLLEVLAAQPLGDH